MGSNKGNVSALTKTGAESQAGAAVVAAKAAQLEGLFKEMGGVLVAFSGGVDSSVLLAAARRTLAVRAVAATGVSASVPSHDLASAKAIAARLGARWITFDSGELEDPDYRGNPSNRCYFCKKSLLGRLLAKAAEERLPVVVEGTNVDDRDDFRPGFKAVQECGVRSPFVEAGIGKAMIRQLARYYGLPNWDKPASACLASRIPYGEEITPERLARIDQCESKLRQWGFRQVRVRDHGTLARLELSVDDMGRLLDGALRQEVVAAFKSAGYSYITLDLQGYRTGAMNETLKRNIDHA